MKTDLRVLVPAREESPSLDRKFRVPTASIIVCGVEILILTFELRESLSVRTFITTIIPAVWRSGIPHRPLVAWVGSSIYRESIHPSYWWTGYAYRSAISIREHFDTNSHLLLLLYDLSIGISTTWFTLIILMILVHLRIPAFLMRSCRDTPSVARDIPGCATLRLYLFIVRYHHPSVYTLGRIQQSDV